MIPFVKNFAKIGKKFLTKAVGIQGNYKETIVETSRNYEACENCKFKNDKKNKFVESYCENYCDKVVEKRIKIVYINEKNKLKIKEDDLRGYIPSEDRLSRLQLSQMILYHFLEPDKNGVIKNASIKEIAKILNCTIKTIKNNNKALMEYGFITTCNSVDNDHINILIHNYDTYHLSQKNGGHGYIVMPKTILKEVSNISSVNALRLLIRKLLKTDNDSREAYADVKSRYTYKDINRMLPGHYNYKGIIDKEINQLNNVFKINKNTKDLEFMLKPIFNGKKQIKKLEEELFINYVAYEEPLNLESKDIFDMVQLGITYGKDIVDKAFNVIWEFFLLPEKEIKNFGGLLRSIIKTRKYEALE